MTMKVLFNGAVLRRPGGATKVDASAFLAASLAGVGIVAVVGEADGGAPNVVNIFSDPGRAAAYFRSGPLADAAGLAFKPMNDERVPGGAALYVAVKTNQSLQAAKTLKNGATDALVITSKDYGVHTNKITVQVTDSGGGKVIALTYADGFNSVSETSPVLGGSAELTIQYTGDGAVATAAVDSTKIQVTLSGTAPTDGSATLTCNHADFKNLADLVAFINKQVGYTATALAPNPYGVKSSDLDWVSAIDVKAPATGSFKAQSFRLIEWVTNFSQLVSAALPASPTIKKAPTTMAAAVTLTGGARGISSNTNFQNALNLLGKVRVNQVIPLVSQDLTNEGFGSTATFASVSAAVASHASYYSSTAGKSERQAWIGMAGTKTAVLAEAATLNDFNTCLLAQKPTATDATGALAVMPEWALAVILAGGRAGSDPGEPLTWKYLRIYGLTQDASWNPSDDGDDLIAAGVQVVEQVPAGFRLIKGVTTYTRQDNDAYTEESVVQTWKQVAYELRTDLENRFVGRKGTVIQVSSVKSQAEARLELHRKAGMLVDSVFSDGSTLKAFREMHAELERDVLSFAVTVSPVEGINYILNSIYLVPAQISA